MLVDLVREGFVTICATSSVFFSCCFVPNLNGVETENFFYVGKALRYFDNIDHFFTSFIIVGSKNSWHHDILASRLKVQGD